LNRSIIFSLANGWVAQIHGIPLFIISGKTTDINVDHNSGFDKKFPEILRDSFRDNLVQWLLGIAGSIITAVILVHH
jgi:hypothetical protein